MAEALLPKPARKLKIKIGAEVITANIYPGRAGQQDDVCNARQQLQRCSAEERLKLLQEARATEKLLKGYVGPSASSSAIVTCLQRDSPFQPSAALPAWDSLFATQASAGDQQPQAKRPRLTPSMEQQVQREPSRTCSLQPTVLAPSQPITNKLSCNMDEHSQACAAAGKVGKFPGHIRGPEKLMPVAHAAAAGMDCGTESNSDQATNSQLYVPVSPDDYTQQGVSLAPMLVMQGQRQTQAGSSYQQVAIATDQGPNLLSRTAAAAGPGLIRLRTHTCSQGVQTSSLDYPLLPPNFLEGEPSNSLSMEFANLGGYDFHMPPSALPLPSGSRSSEASIKERIGEAQNTKRAGDALRNSVGAWDVCSLGKYVEASLMFMEACEWMQQTIKPGGERTRVVDLYSQTSELLGVSAKWADSIRSAGLAKEALRILAERLAAVCCLRSAAFNTPRLTDCARRASDALREHHARKEQAWAAAAAGRLGRAGHPSPEDSTTSSMDQSGPTGHSAARSSQQQQPHVQPPQQLIELQGRLVQEAKKISRYGDLVRKSASGFQTFIEHASVRCSVDAQRLCMHLAALCMDMGMTPGACVLHHARGALEGILAGQLPS